MNFCQTALFTRRESTVQSLTELIHLFESEALWESVETIRAVLERVRAWDLAAASRLFWQLDPVGVPATISAGVTRDAIAARSAAVGSLLYSMTTITLDDQDCLVEN